MDKKIGKNSEKLEDSFDTVVIGGGLAGICAAIAAARLGCKVALVQDRPVLGGNSSSEIRVPVGGAGDFHYFARETGIIEELRVEDCFRNHEALKIYRTNSIWDLILYEWVTKEPNIALFLNTSAREAIMANANKIERVICSQLGTEKTISLKADIFIDASGDGALAYSAGAEFRMGREARNEFNESLAPEQADMGIMGNSLIFRARNMGHPVPFVPPGWAVDFPKEEDLLFRGHQDIEAGYWWIEIGAPFDTIADNERIRDELLRQLLGVWDHIKNHGDHGAENWALDWIGMVPGKRESRRFIGDYILTENDVRSKVLFPDRVAYGGWFIDLHTPGGILARKEPPEPCTGDPKLMDERYVGPYSIPFRCLYSRNIENLMFAGRNISVTHVALGTTRLMATCAVMGQAVGAAAYLCKKYQTTPRKIYQSYIEELQQLLLKQDCFIMGLKNQDARDLARTAKVTASSAATLEIPAREEAHPLDVPRGQLFPVSESYIQSISLLLESRIPEEVEVSLGLREAKNLWDFGAQEDIASATAKVPSNSTSWVSFEINKEVEPKKFYWLWLSPVDGIFWCHTKAEPIGTIAVHNPPDAKLWPWRRLAGTYCFALNPPSRPYEPENVVSGLARPDAWTNIWISDPSQSLPQYFELYFAEPKSFDTVYLTFDTNLNKLVSLGAAPECVRDYALFCWNDSSWTKLIEVQGNYHRRRIHRFQPVTASKLRLEIISTNGDKSARVYEIRVYKECKGNWRRKDNRPND